MLPHNDKRKETIVADKYRVIENITYVDNGKVVTVKGGLGKEVELTEAQAKTLSGKVVRLAVTTDMFPDGGPLLDPVIATNRAVAEEHHVKPDPEPEPLFKTEVGKPKRFDPPKKPETV